MKYVVAQRPESSETVNFGTEKQENISLVFWFLLYLPQRIWI
jgi:hypothetical protein